MTSGGHIAGNGSRPNGDVAATPRFPWDGGAPVGGGPGLPPPPDPPRAAAPPAPRQRPWRDAAETVLRRLTPPSRDELREHWPAYLLRGATYAGAAFLAGSLLLAALPPILSDTSTRAVVNAPVSLVTAPIDGELDRLLAEPGEPVTGGQVLARIRNDRLDRSTLIGLQNQTEGTRLALAAMHERIRVAENWLVTLDDSIARQRDYALRMAAEAEREARARANAAAAAFAEQAQLAARQRMLQERGVVAESVARVAALRERGSREELNAAEATLARRVAERVSVESGSYVGDGQAALGALVERRRDSELELTRLRVELRQLTSSLAALEQQTGAEEVRLRRLLAADVSVPSSGHVLRAFASPGQRLGAGDTIAGTVECGRTFVVAIFSVRQAHRLPLGTRVVVTADGWQEQRRGVVMQVLPRTTDRVDTGYAVPFPPMERREMYVLVEFDDGSPRRWSRTAAERFGGSVPCDIGRWVSVEIDGGVVSDAARAAVRAVRSLFGRAPVLAPGQMA